VLIVAGLSVLGVACSPVPSPPPVSPGVSASQAASAAVAATVPAGPEGVHLGGLRLSLERAGLDVGTYSQDTTKLDKEATPLFPGAPLHPHQLQVAGALVLAFPFAESGEASAVVSRIDRKQPFGFIEFTGMPHVFLYDNTIVMFVEDGLHKKSAPRDSRIFAVLRSEYGTDYASLPGSNR
jgi:hypothetical protein